MIGILTQGLLQTQASFIATAAVICSAMAGTLLLLMRNAEIPGRTQKIFWMVWITIVAGVGVWTTHFVAMIGYRPDAALTYDVRITLISVVVGIFGVGIPLAMSCRTRNRATLALLGGLAGLGVSATHFSGMSALEGCIATYDPLVAGLGIFLGTACFAAALALRPRNAGRQIVRGLGIVAGVCSLHFLAMSGLTLEVLEHSRPGMSQIMLTAMVTMASVGLCLIAAVASRARFRLLAERRSAERAAETQQKAFVTALQNMSNGLVMVNAEGIIVAINQRTFELFDISATDEDGDTRLRTLIERIGQRHSWTTDHVDEKFAPHLQLVGLGRPSHSEEELSDGRILHVACRSLPEGGVVITFDDVTAHRVAQAKIVHIARHDPLTGLQNRRAFQEYFAGRDGIAAGRAVLLLDLDHFKNVNDTLGHSIGDALLVAVADTLRRTVEDAGAVFRLGGDEIVVLLDDRGEGSAARLGASIIARIGQPFEIQGHTIAIGCSIGLHLPAEGEDPSTLLQKADLALYRAKAQGRNRIALYEDGMQEKARARRQRELELAQAIAEEQFVLNYQPLFRLPGREIVGFEALIRWPHPDHGLISPAEFIPLAEETGMIVEIGAWVLDEACRQLSMWPEDLAIAVNVSAVQMRLPSIVETVRATLGKYDLDPSRLTLELTETAIVSDGKRLSENIVALRQLGVQIAMDDFGTGYSSLAHLRNFELDEIKIDRSFINVSNTDKGAWAVTQAVLGMAKGLSVGTVGEGVETQEQLAQLMYLGCDVVQGFLLSRPLSAEQAEELLFESSAETNARTFSISQSQR